MSPSPARRSRRMLLVVPLLAGSALTATACPPPPPPGCTPVTLGQGHVDGPGIAFEDGAFDLHVHDEESDTEYEAECAVLQVRDEAETDVPADPSFGFLGAAGAPVWVLPQVENPALLYLGYATEEIEAGTFEGDEITWSLVGVEGPGSFALYSVDQFGAPTVVFDSDDALPQSIQVPTGDHVHANWAFGAEGTYTLTYQASGTPTGGSPVTSDEVEFTFQVGS